MKTCPPLESVRTCVSLLLVFTRVQQQNIILIYATASLLAASTQNGYSGSWSSHSQNEKSVFSTWFQLVKRPAEELTCAGIVIDPDVARMADAHEGARGVNAHGVLPAVVLPFSTLINIWREGREKERGGEQSWVRCGFLSQVQLNP